MTSGAHRAIEIKVHIQSLIFSGVGFIGQMPFTFHYIAFESECTHLKRQRSSNLRVYDVNSAM